MERIDAFFENFNIKKPDKIVKLANRYFYDKNNSIEFCNTHRIKPFSVGTFIGEENNRRFVPSPGILELVKDTEKRVRVNERGEWLFSCGRDLFNENILSFQASIKDVVGVENLKGELVGLGILERAPKDAKKTDVVVKNILDIGSFLRREKNS